MQNNILSIHQEPEPQLGELEAAIMQIVWSQDEVTVRSVWQTLQPTRALAYTTIMTVMSRLAQKGILTTRKQGKTYHYKAAASPQQFVEQQAQRAVQDVIDSFGEVAIAQFLRAIDSVDTERLAALRKLVKEESSDET
jgi:predicted transcriptional regulator